MEQGYRIEITCMEVSPLREEKLFAAWLEKMPATRRQKIASLRNAESQRLSLGVGILLFQAMQKRGIDPARTEIAESSRGKPFLPDVPDFHFSLSHAGVWVMCAVWSRPVGCDVERIGRGDLRIARRFFHAEEAAALERETDPEAWNRLFTRIWTRKEAFLKRTGEGLYQPMNSFSALSPPDGIRYCDGMIAEKYAFSCCVYAEKEPTFVQREIALQ